MSFNFGKSNQLQEPGNGLPTSERIILNLAFKTGCFLMSDNQALRLFQKESTQLFQLADHVESYDVFQALMVPRVIGIEDSSRNWSVMMVLEHLCMVNRDILKIVSALTEGAVPKGEIDVAFYKPQEDLTFDVLARFSKFNQDYGLRIGDLLAEHETLVTSKRYPHPWFGPLNAHQWHCLAAVHQRIHRRQSQKIIAMLGVA